MEFIWNTDNQWVINMQCSNIIPISSVSKVKNKFHNSGLKHKPVSLNSWISTATSTV
jgi:hypothetical protein